MGTYLGIKISPENKEKYIFRCKETKFAFLGVRKQKQC